MWEETVSFQTTGNNVNNAEQWLACALYVDYHEPRQKKRQQEITNENKKATTTPKEAGDVLFNGCDLCLLKIYHNRF